MCSKEVVPESPVSPLESEHRSSCRELINTPHSFIQARLCLKTNARDGRLQVGDAADAAHCTLRNDGLPRATLTAREADYNSTSRPRRHPGHPGHTDAFKLICTYVSSVRPSSTLIPQIDKSWPPCSCTSIYSLDSTRLVTVPPLHYVLCTEGLHPSWSAKCTPWWSIE